MHGGNLEQIRKKYNLNIEDLIDFSVNINPLGFPEETRRIISRAVSSLTMYPDPEYYKLRKVLAEYEQCSVNQIVPGNGSSELLFFILLTLKPVKAIIPVPGYIDYTSYSERLNIPIEFITLSPDQEFRLSYRDLHKILSHSSDNSVLILGSPNNPNGNCINPEKIEALADAVPNIYLIIDLAYADFCTHPGIKLKKNIILIKSLTKIYAVPGLRFGYLITDPLIAGQIRTLLPEWNVSSIAEEFVRNIHGNRDYLRHICSHGWNQHGSHRCHGCHSSPIHGSTQL